MQRRHLSKFQEDLGKELGIAIFPEGWENGLGTVASPVRLTDYITGIKLDLFLIFTGGIGK